ncbi:MAG: ABC transporter substrate-binding protein [Rhodospirillaceae bacterium]|nr:ABC transporter substrate-binding protein [Rhodospirillaceae bacterium]
MKEKIDMARLVRLTLFTLTIVLTSVSVSVASSPRDRIESLNATLLEIMQNADELGYAGRYEKLQPVMPQLYDFALMSRIAVGVYWKKLAPEQQKQLTEAFSRMSIATYAARFDGYSGETFEIVSAEKSVRDTMLVKTRLIKSDGSPVALNYLTRPSGEDWRIIDVFLDARFSELARLRADYTAVIKRQGFDSLLSTIEAKIAEMQKQ